LAKKLGRCGVLQVTRRATHRKSTRTYTVLYEMTDTLRYINFAHGDETPEAIYGSSLPKLKQLKKQYDPAGLFNQWFTIKP
jgi:FAD/FMN-containing dehydrogenase